MIANSHRADDTRVALDAGLKRKSIYRYSGLRSLGLHMLILVVFAAGLGACDIGDNSALNHTFALKFSGDKGDSPGQQPELADNAAVGNSCQPPRQLKPWDYYAERHIRSGRDWRNAVATDSWRLVYSWSPHYCAGLSAQRRRETHQCRMQAGFIVHGLWAQSATANSYRQHPRNCVDTPAIKVDILRAHFCAMPSVKLMQQQWERHGSCDFNRPAAYFAQLQDLHQRLHLPSKSQLDTIFKQHSVARARRALANWLIKHNQQVPSTVSGARDTALSAQHFIIDSEAGEFKGLSVCFDRDFKLAPCRA